MFSRDFRRPRGAKTKHIFESGVWCGVVCAFRGGVSSCPLVAGGRLFVACPLLSWRVPSLLSALSLCAWCIACKYGSISRFKAVFSVAWALRVGLCCLDALRGLCGFCARVELGGLKACGVFAFRLSFFLLLCSAFVLLFSACLSLLWLSFFVLLHCLSFPCGLLLLFPLRIICAKEKGAKCCPLRPLFVCCVLVIFLCNY